MDAGGGGTPGRDGLRDLRASDYTLPDDDGPIIVTALGEAPPTDDMLRRWEVIAGHVLPTMLCDRVSVSLSLADEAAP